jgi:hypothetical protein
LRCFFFFHSFFYFIRTICFKHSTRHNFIAQTSPWKTDYEEKKMKKYKSFLMIILMKFKLKKSFWNVFLFFFSNHKSHSIAKKTHTHTKKRPDETERVNAWFGLAAHTPYGFPLYHALLSSIPYSEDSSLLSHLFFHHPHCLISLSFLRLLFLLPSPLYILGLLHYFSP